MLEVYGVALVPFIIGLIELGKRSGLKPKYAPFVGIGIGVILGVFFLSTNIKEGLLIGVALGLSASGLYSGTKNMLEKEDE